ncbi:hypothetical protein B296_00015666, partial [Ensete ventricosum]
MERIYVAVRARPLSPEESKSSPWRISGNSIYLASQSTKFEFGRYRLPYPSSSWFDAYHRIFGEDRNTVDVYEARTKEIVASAVSGFNVRVFNICLILLSVILSGTVFAYGQTNSGKTHTMRGSVAEPGIIPLAVHDLFLSIQEDIDREFLVRMSYMEIYNEEINDLLAPEHRKLQIHESLEVLIHVPYRDSKLTRILQPALGGNANTAIICNITLAQVIYYFATLSSHSEHWEEEILNLRNTLLQSELEKERIQLELEEEKKTKAHREKRLLEQAQKIANLSSLVLYSERDDKSTYLNKVRTSLLFEYRSTFCCYNKRRVTWCPVPSSRKCMDEVNLELDPTSVHVPDSAASEHTRHDSDIGLPIPFEELMQEIETSVGNMNCDAFMPDNMENTCDVMDLTFPDAHALLHVTDRRKIHSKTTGSFRVF